MTTDNFALLNEPRRPWLDLELLKTKFLALSSETHPDHHHGGSETEKLAATRHYAALNAAYNCLHEPKDRLLHLLELERGAKPVALQSIPSETMDLFAKVATVCREADAFLAEKSSITSQLLRVQMFELGTEWTERLQALQRTLNAQRDIWMQELKSMNRAWESSPDPKPLDRLEELYRHFSFIARWTVQIQERLVQLSI